MRINEKGDWTELHDISIGTQAPKRYMEIVGQSAEVASIRSLTVAVPCHANFEPVTEPRP